MYSLGLISTLVGRLSPLHALATDAQEGYLSAERQEAQRAPHPDHVILSRAPLTRLPESVSDLVGIARERHATLHGRLLH